MSSVYHEGELAVQARAGVQEMARRSRLIDLTIPLAAQGFLGRQPMAILGTVDDRGWVWASVLTGEPGFMQALNERQVRINARPSPGDPLGENIRINDQVGMIIIEPATRRRMRLNGRVEVRSDGTIEVQAQQVYANCPKYIQARSWERNGAVAVPAQSVWNDTHLTKEQRRWIGEADTFFIASSHHKGGVDASHRGGNPGFVRVLNEGLLAWPDYAGNMMFQTLGNIAVNPHAGLLFMDFEHGKTLQLTGRAEILWDAERAETSSGADRVLAFHLDRAIEVENATDLRWRFLGYSPFNPAQ